MPAKSMTIEERPKYLSLQRERYLSASRQQKGVLLDEMQEVTRLNRSPHPTHAPELSP